MAKKYMENIEKEYQSALDYLYTFVDFSLTKQDRLAAAKFDLSRMVELLNLLGDPQKKYPIVHIAGTKGKGSTSAMIASVLENAGYRVGLYTSPHLQDYCERIQINRKNLDHGFLVKLVDQLKPMINQVPGLTTFELTTAIGFLAFADAKVDIAVIEVGLGGRLDATNVVTPLISVITSISYDHMAVLGNTLGQIASEKAGIIKHDCPVVMAPQVEIPARVIQETAALRNAPLVQVGLDYLYSSGDHSISGQDLYVWSKEEQDKMNAYLDSESKTDWQPEKLCLPLLGYHQVQNAATAYTAIQVIRQKGIKIEESAIQAGFLDVKWPGRFEILCQDPFIVIDSAHNEDSALKLRIALDDYLPKKSILLVFGVSEDKDIFGIFNQLMPCTKMVIATQSSHPRACPANKLVELAHRFGRKAHVTYDIPEALEYAIKQAGPDDAIIVAGSIFVAAAAREAWPALERRIQEIRMV